MAARRHLRPAEGFTLIEILVVLLIIGVLAAIALPTFIGQTETAKDTEAKVLSRTLQTHAETCFEEERSWSSCDSASDLAKTQLAWGTDAGEVQVLVRPFGRDAVAFAATSSSGTLFAILRGIDDRTISHVCLVPARAYPTGGCKRGGPFAGNGFGTW